MEWRSIPSLDAELAILRRDLQHNMDLLQLAQRRDAVEEIQQLKSYAADLGNDIRRLEDQRRNTLDAIGRLPEKYRTVASCRLVRRLSWERTSLAAHYSIGYLKKIYSQALKMMGPAPDN